LLLLNQRMRVKTVRKVSEMRSIIREVKKEGKSIGLVPTMGYFHEGHLSLIREAGKECDILIVSIFVNPTQFGPSEDYEHYPRDLGRDELIAEREEVDFNLTLPISGRRTHSKQLLSKRWYLIWIWTWKYTFVRLFGRKMGLR